MHGRLQSSWECEADLVLYMVNVIRAVFLLLAMPDPILNNNISIRNLLPNEQRSGKLDEKEIE
jgi:hypothetical protein